MLGPSYFFALSPGHDHDAPPGRQVDPGMIPVVPPKLQPAASVGFALIVEALPMA
jgi:hypothetical protein